MKKWIASLISIMFTVIAICPLTILAGEKGKYNGKVANINQDQKNFQLITSDKTWTTRWTDKTDFIFEGKKTTSDQLKNDVQVLVLAIQDDDGVSLDAVIVAWGEAPGKDPKDPGKEPGEGRQTPTIFGKLNNFNRSTKTLDLIAKDPQGNEVIFKVTYREETKFVREKKLAKPEDFTDGEEITVAGKIDINAKTIDALLIVLGKVEAPKDPGKDPGGDKQPPTVIGIIKQFNLEGLTFKLVSKDPQGKEIIFEVVFSKETKFFVEKKPVAPSEFKNGDTVTVAGRIDTENKKIQALIVAKGSSEQPTEPIIKWEKEAIIRERFSIFNEESIDITFKSTVTKDLVLKVTVSESWLQLKSDQVKLSEGKISLKILGEKLTAWKTNTAVIDIQVSENPKLNRKIFVSIEAIGNIVVVKIGSKKAMVNLKEVTLDEGSIPLLKNGRTFVSIKFMSEIVFNNKAKTSFESKTQTVYFTLGSKKIELYIGKTYALVNGVKVTLDAPPFIQNGRTFVPLRFISENFDATVSYEAKSQTISIVYPGKVG